jgi:hypothetical protein
VIFEDPNGGVQDLIIYRDEEHTLQMASAGPVFSFDADGSSSIYANAAAKPSKAHHFRRDFSAPHLASSPIFLTKAVPCRSNAASTS